MEVYLHGGRTVGDPRLVVEEQHQGGTLPQVVTDGSLAHNPAGLFHEIGREVGVIERCRTAHGKPPGVTTVCVSILCPCIVYPCGRGKEKPYR
jgi:hypothetical protein